MTVRGNHTIPFVPHTEPLVPQERPDGRRPNRAQVKREVRKGGGEIVWTAGDACTCCRRGPVEAPVCVAVPLGGGPFMSMTFA